MKREIITLAMRIHLVWKNARREQLAFTEVAFPCEYRKSDSQTLREMRIYREKGTFWRGHESKSRRTIPSLLSIKRTTKVL